MSYSFKEEFKNHKEVEDKIINVCVPHIKNNYSSNGLGFYTKAGACFVVKELLKKQNLSEENIIKLVDNFFLYKQGNYDNYVNSFVIMNSTNEELMIDFCYKYLKTL